MDSKIILFEANEVPFRILDEFTRWRPESTLARRLPQFRQFTSYCEDGDPELSPWRIWPSVYRGVGDEQHGVHNLGQTLDRVDREFPPLWKLLTDHGIKTGVFGSLHSYPLPDDLENYSFYIPDTFAAGSECFPKSVSPFQAFNLSMVAKSGRNISTSVPWASALALLARAPGLGFKTNTLTSAVGQVVSERSNRWKKSRRRSLQAMLAFDVFMRQLQRTRPDFATFFTNNIASSLHRFWAAAFPSDYDRVEYPEEWIQTYRGEIDFAMGRFDRMVSRLLDFADRHGYELWITTGIGQAATKAKPLQTLIYPTDLPKFMRTIGIADDEWETRPAMVAQVNVAIVPSKQAHFREQMKGIRVDGEPLKYAEADDGFFSMWWGHEDYHDKGECITLHGKSMPMGEHGLSYMRLEECTNSNAYHIREGCLLIYDSRAPYTGRSERSQVSNLELAPTLLRNFGVEVPGYMREPVSLAG